VPLRFSIILRDSYIGDSNTNMVSSYLLICYDNQIRNRSLVYKSNNWHWYLK